MPFIPMTGKNREEMLKVIGVADFEELLAAVPDQARFKGMLDLPDPLSEWEVTKLMHEMAAQNAHAGSHICFLGGGAYDHFIPAAVDHLISRSEFYTAYTPYQPEVAQGNLQAIYEYQSMIAELTGMDVANASMYDGASALAEAALLIHNQTRRPRIVVSKSVHPFTRQVIRTYCHSAGIEVLEAPLDNGITDTNQMKALINEDTAGLLVQHPNFFGALEPVEILSDMIHEAGGLFGVSADPMSLALLKPPGAFGADVAVGEGQVFGNPLNLGGPYVGIFAVKNELVRRLPGRLVGITEDTQGRRGFVLTLQTREQHIRRDKATSSICTNEQLCALASAIYLSLLGKEGLPAVADLCLQKSHYLAGQLTQIPGYSLYYDQPFFKEFAVHCPVAPQKIINLCLKHKIFAGVHLNRFDYGIEDGLLIAVTEKRSKAEMDKLVELLRGLT